jgi:hypothetical protein
MKSSGERGSLENGVDAMEVEGSHPSPSPPTNKPNCDIGGVAILANICYGYDLIWPRYMIFWIIAFLWSMIVKIIAIVSIFLILCI